MTTGLEDGTRIEPHRHAWVVVDRFQCVLTDVEDAMWMVEPDEEDILPGLFATPEAAYRALLQANAVAKIRAERREEALKRLAELRS